MGLWQIALMKFLKIYFLTHRWTAKCQKQEADSNFARYV